MKAIHTAIVAVALVVGLSGEARSGGFALEEQSVSGLGNAFAGGAAVAEDASTIFSNPAGLTRLQGQNAAAGAHLILPNVRFRKDEARDAGGAPLAGGEGGDAGKNVVVPNAYYSATLRSGLAFGFGLSVPFGLATDYSENWVGRYHAVKSEVSAVNLNPSVAYRVTEQWSVGAGFNAQRLAAEMTNRVDFGAFLGMPQAADGMAKLTGENWGYGWNVGTLVALGSGTRVGVAYRSRVKHDIEATAEFKLPEGLPPEVSAGLAASGFRDTDAEVSITLPDSASISFFHALGAKWAAMADVTWTNWSTFDELRVRFDSGLPDDATEEDWKDSWRYAVGLTYRPTPAWAWRLGVAYDRDPIPDAEHRTPRIPSNDRFWTAFGVGYRPTPWLAVDLGYAHLFVRDAKIERNQDALRGVLAGSYEISPDIFSAQLTATF
jgi:long-chain fatty acid transport protein